MEHRMSWKTRLGGPEAQQSPYHFPEDSLGTEAGHESRMAWGLTPHQLGWLAPAANRSQEFLHFKLATGLCPLCNQLQQETAGPNLVPGI